MLKKTVNILIVLNFILVLLQFLTTRAAQPVISLEDVSPGYIATILYEPTTSSVPINETTISKVSGLSGIIHKDSYTVTEFFTESIGEMLDVVGVSRPNFSILQSGVIEITEGRTFTEREIKTANQQRVPVLVPQSWADENNWEIGSNFNLRQENLLDTPFIAEVIGIFESQQSELVQNIPADAIILPDSVIQKSLLTFAEILYADRPDLLEAWKTQANPYNNNVTFTLSSSIDVEQFRESADEILGPNHHIRIAPIH